MNPAILPLAQRIELQIDNEAREAVENALTQARSAAYRAYADALGGLCGHRLEMIVSEAMHDAETRLAEAAHRVVVKNRTDAVLKQLSGDNA